MNSFVRKLGPIALAALLMATGMTGCERKAGMGNDGSGTGEILIGEYGSLTGDGASFGQSSKEGIEMAIDEINAAGGVLGGRKLRVLVEDDQSRPEEASTAVTKLITQDKVVAVLGEVASRRSLAAAPICQKYQVPMITPSSTNEAVTAVGDYIFRVCFVDGFQGQVLAKFAYNDLKARRIAILKDVKQDYSVGLTDSITQAFTSLGGQVVTTVSYGTGDQDFRSPLTNIRGQNVDAIFVTGYYPEAGIISRQARELGLKMPLLGGDGWVGDALWTGRDSLNNSYISNHFSGDDPSPIVQKFVSDYKARYGGKEPDSIAALAYDATKVLADAITRAGTTENVKLRDAIAQTKNFAGVTGSLTMNDKRNVDKTAIIQEVVFANGQGKFEYETKIEPG